MKALKVFIKPSEAPQRNVKIKILLSFLTLSGIGTLRVNKNEMPNEDKNLIKNRLNYSAFTGRIITMKITNGLEDLNSKEEITEVDSSHLYPYGSRPGILYGIASDRSMPFSSTHTFCNKHTIM